VLLVTSPRVAAGLLSADAWTAATAGPVFMADSANPAVVTLAAAGADVTVVDAAQSPGEIADAVMAAVRRHGTATWWVGPDGDPEVSRALAERCADQGPEPAITLEVLHGSWDTPGSRLLDVVATMDRLRSPGGCPWDAEQDHGSLAPYLLEEAYEAFQAIEDDDIGALREELGDVLLQVAFHARLAEELPEDERWSIDDVAGDLVDKLIRRHPHVFEDVAVSGADEVNANWEAIKAAERPDASVLANVPLAAPALTLAATLQRKAARAGAGDLDTVGVDEAMARFTGAPTPESTGDLLWSIVALLRGSDIDPEAALRARSRAFRDAFSAKADPDG
jgi:XTP/dITP diphosphohydrolase